MGLRCAMPESPPASGRWTPCAGSRLKKSHRDDCRVTSAATWHIEASNSRVRTTGSHYEPASIAACDLAQAGGVDLEGGLNGARGHTAIT